MQTPILLFPALGREGGEWREVIGRIGCEPGSLKISSQFLITRKNRGIQFVRIVKYMKGNGREG